MGALWQAGLVGLLVVELVLRVGLMAEPPCKILRLWTGGVRIGLGFRRRTSRDQDVWRGEGLLLRALVVWMNKVGITIRLRHVIEISHAEQTSLMVPFTWEEDLWEAVLWRAGLVVIPVLEPLSLEAPCFRYNHGAT